jgi:hypothetical protein
MAVPFSVNKAGRLHFCHCHSAFIQPGMQGHTLGSSPLREGDLE